MKKIIAFNWKMNPVKISDIRSVMKEIRKYSEVNKNAKIIIAPPFIYLKELVSYFKNYNVKISSQDLSQFYKEGPFTGEISSEMLKNIGVKYSIIGHSERRYLIGESDSVIHKKIKLAEKSGIIPILCIGEKSKMSFKRAKEFIIRQLFADLDFSSVKRILIAYEPVWSIGGNKDINQERASSMIYEIQKITKRRLNVNVPVLYGGSVNSNNIDKFMSYKNINGFLIGHSSLLSNDVKYIMSKILN